MKIGLVGEAPHDIKCIDIILSKRYPKLKFIPMISHIHGAQLDQQQPVKSLLRIEYQIKKPDLVIVIRDLDSHEDDKSAKRKRREQFNALKSVVDGKALLLLNIQEIEALILADVQKFGGFFGCPVNVYPDPCIIANPKEELKTLSKKYNEVKNSKIFDLLDISTLSNACKYFNKFLKDFDKLVVN